MGIVGRLRAIGLAVVGGTATAKGRIAPVAHHLALRRSSTAHREVLRRQQGIAAILVPMGFEQGVDAVVAVAVLAGVAGTKGLPPCGIGLAGLHLHLDAEGYLLAVGLKAFGHGQGQGVGPQGRQDGVAQHGARAVVGCDKHETTSLADEEIHLGILPRSLCQHTLAAEGRGPEVVGHTGGIGLVDRPGHGSEGHGGHEEG